MDAYKRDAEKERQREKERENRIGNSVGQLDALPPSDISRVSRAGEL